MQDVVGWQAALVEAKRILVNGSEAQGLLKVCFGTICLSKNTALLTGIQYCLLKIERTEEKLTGEKHLALQSWPHPYLGIASPVPYLKTVHGYTRKKICNGFFLP